jgi:class 3 adenylate cyclase
MFADIAGSSKLSTRLDPEDLREVLAGYHGCLTDVVAHFAGFIARYMGDGALVYFGYPKPDEDDPKRAVRAGLAIVETVSGLKTIAGILQVRVGIATGPVVIHKADSLEPSVVGITSDLAARLQTVAAPNTVVIAESTRRLAGETFEYRMLGPVPLKGFPEPVSAWTVIPEVTGKRTFEDQGESLHPIEGVPSPIGIIQRSDGRIGADSGSLASLNSLAPEDHAQSLSACRLRAERLHKLASAPRFNGRSEYGEALAAYCEWLPTPVGTGNILLADGEARVLNKLFNAEEDILPAGFAAALAVLLEEHIGLRVFYPELERHYLAIRTGRLIRPLARDAVRAIQRVIRANTPDLFHESVGALVDETGKPIPEVRPPGPEDIPLHRPKGPRPPKDPVSDIDPAKLRSFTFASAINRIFDLLQKGKDLPAQLDGWRKAYDQIKPHAGAVLQWLRDFWPGA